VSRCLTSLHRRLVVSLPHLRYTSSLLESQPIATLPSIRALELHLVAAFTQPSVTSAVIFQWRQKLLCQPQLPLHRASDSGCYLCLPWGKLKLFGPPTKGLVHFTSSKTDTFRLSFSALLVTWEEASSLSNHGSDPRSNLIAPLRPVKKTTLRSSPGGSTGCCSKLIGTS
jgi:hypothetical protein